MLKQRTHHIQCSKSWVIAGLLVGLVTLIGLIVYGNHQVFIFLNHLKIQQLSDSMWLNVTALGNKMLVISLALILARWKMHLIPAIAIAIVSGGLIVWCIKHGLNVLRPAAILNSIDINVIGAIKLYHSFPSGHTAAAFVLTALICQVSVSIWLKIVVLFLALSVGFSRLMLGAHWPVDIVAGATIAWIISFLALKYSYKLPVIVASFMHYGFILGATGVSVYTLIYADVIVAEQAVFLTRSIAGVALICSCSFLWTLPAFSKKNNKKATK